jgi:HEAT repeat protein
MEAFWAKLAKDSGLSATSAAEALVQQAQSGDRKVRLAAIDSLGTLAVPETLPVLIRLMQDQDAEVATRAGAAVQRINAGKK